MSYGLLQAGNHFKSDAMRGLSDVARLEENRNQTNQSLKTAKRSGEMTAMGTGAATGAMMGAKMGAAGGPMGIAIGAGIGLLAGWALS